MNEPKIKIIRPRAKDERKDKKVLVLMKPSTYEGLKKKATKYQISTNELINQILDSNI